jgi:putative transport protein
MTNSAALGTSMDVMNNMSGDVPSRYAELDDADKTRVLEMIGAEDTTPTDQLTGEQVGAFLGKAKANISAGFAISFPVGTIGIILAMTILAMLTKKNKPADQHHDDGTKNPNNPALQRPIVYDAVIFGIVICVGIIIGSIEIPLGHSVSFSLSAVGGILISALVFSNIPKIGPIDMRVHPKSLAFIREMSLIFFMSVVGLANGYKVVSALSGSGVVLAIMALVIEVVAILLSIVLGRFILKLNWGLLSGAICGGCTSAVGLGTALNTMDSDEPTLGYGAAQPFAILANVLLISMFHSLFFI